MTNPALDALQKLAEDVRGNKPPGKRGAPKKASTVAREEQAAKEGITPDAIRKRERRHGKPQSLTAFKDMGFQLADEFKAQVAKAQGYLDECASLLQQAAAKLTLMSKDQEALFPKQRLQRLHTEITGASGMVRGARPISLCPWCKGQERVQDECTACHATGYITRSQEATVPEELLDPDVVQISGEVVPIGATLEERRARLGDGTVVEEADEWGLGS